MENYTHSALKIVIAQMCQVLGWHAMQPVTLDILVDLLHRYLLKLGSTTCEYALLANRTEPNLEDLFSTFHHMRINLEEMRSFVQHVEMPRSLANFPFKQKAVSKLKFDHCASSDTYVCSPNERLVCVGERRVLNLLFHQKLA